MLKSDSTIYVSVDVEPVGLSNTADRSVKWNTTNIPTLLIEQFLTKIC